MQAQANWENQLLALAGNLHTRPRVPSSPIGQAMPRFSKAYKQAEKITAAAQQILSLCIRLAARRETLRCPRPVCLLPNCG